MRTVYLSPCHSLVGVHGDSVLVVSYPTVSVAHLTTSPLCIEHKESLMSAFTPDDNTPIESLDQLHSFMLARCKNSDEWLIGTEHEKFGYSVNTGARPSFRGQIEELFLSFEREGWVTNRELTPSGEEGDIISLERDGANITLEPGGQLELSGAPLSSLEEMSNELDSHLEELSFLSEPLGLIWSGLGTDPTPHGETPKMPKARYQVMRRYLHTKGSLALQMMHSTSPIQTNLDYANEADAMRKLRAGLYLQPLVMGMFANSFLLDGKLRDGNCARSNIWLNTDNDRYLYPAEWLDENTPLMNYVRWAIKTPMFFIARGGQYIDCSGLPFEQFMRDGVKGHSPTMGDFELHLSTLFPDTRLKQHLEVRGADMSSPDYVKALSALHVGLMYDEQALDQTLSHFESTSAESLWRSRAEVDLQGLNTQLNGQSFQSHAEEILEIARGGLSRREPASVHLLDPVVWSIQRGESPAIRNRALWAEGYEALMRGTRLA